MFMNDITFVYTDAFIWHSLIYSLLFIVAIIPVGLVNPRIMLRDYPKEIQAAVPPKTEEERGMMVFFAVPLVVIMAGYPAGVSWYYRPEEATFQYFFATTWAMMITFNLFDLLVIDWLLFCTITPKLVVIRGTEGNPGYKNYRFHFLGFLKGIAITAFLSAFVSGVLVLFTKL